MSLWGSAAPEGFLEAILPGCCHRAMLTVTGPDPAGGDDENTLWALARSLRMRLFLGLRSVCVLSLSFPWESPRGIP